MLVETLLNQKKKFSVGFTTHYSYDVHGNVDTLLQDNPTIPIAGQRFKKTVYNFDLISGNVNSVAYQDGEPDASYHFYEYDLDNRLVAVYSSTYPQPNALININTVANSPLWDNDAKYFYYLHGPLARVEYGDNKVQGMDYAYTLQGWIKGVNSTTLDSMRDIGQDAFKGGINSNFAKDALGYVLNYHKNDYKAIDGLKWNNVNNRFESVIAGSDLNNARVDLFNGNISSMVTTLEKPMIYTGAVNATPSVMPQGTAYKYDQLNRLKQMEAYANLDIPTNTWQSGSTYTGMYQNLFNYDANGNIQYQRRADSAGVVFDELTYRYNLDANNRLFQNRLYHVNDSIASTTLEPDDIHDEGTFTSNPNTINSTNNYEYDEIGNLKHDSQESIEKIEWTVYGKIKKIIRVDTSSKPDLEFNYDASGNRISKIVKPHGSSVENGGADAPAQWTTTYYMRDAQGNIMTTYLLASPASATSFKVIERNMFGSSRLGTDNTEIELIAALPISTTYCRTLGNKHYEASNHLGNVLTVFTDRKIPVSTDNVTIDHYDADIVNTFDYSPFGAPMDERTFRLVMKYTDDTHTASVPAFVNGKEPFANIASESLTYRYGFNGMEKDDEIKGIGNSYTTEFRIYDPRLGRWLSIDPVNRVDISRYAFASNMVILRVDPKGDDDYYNEKGNYLYTDTKTSNDVRFITQASWEEINQNYSTQIADPKTSYKTLLVSLDEKSRVATIKVEGKQSLSLWNRSKPNAKVTERKETSANIVLDFEKGTIEFVTYPNGENTNHSSNPNINEDGTDKKTGLPVIANIHTHPKDRVQDFGGKEVKREPKDESADHTLAQKHNIPVFQLDVEFLDIQMPNHIESQNNAAKSDELFKGDYDLGRKALELHGGKPQNMEGAKPQIKQGEKPTPQEEKAKPQKSNTN